MVICIDRSGCECGSVFVFVVLNVPEICLVKLRESDMLHNYFNARPYRMV